MQSDSRLYKARVAELVMSLDMTVTWAFLSFVLSVSKRYDAMQLYKVRVDLVMSFHK